MNKFLLSWIVGYGKQASGGNKKYPTWEDIVYYLEKVKTSNGSVTLDVMGENIIGPVSLQVLADQSKFILSLGEDTGTDYIVRSYRNGELNSKECEILGDSWDSSLICTKLEVVIEVFNEFFDTGKVNNKLLN